MGPCQRPRSGLKPGLVSSRPLVRVPQACFDARLRPAPAAPGEAERGARERAASAAHTSGDSRRGGARERVRGTRGRRGWSPLAPALLRWRDGLTAHARYKTTDALPRFLFCFLTLSNMAEAKVIVYIRPLPTTEKSLAFPRVENKELGGEEASLRLPDRSRCRTTTGTAEDGWRHFSAV